MVKKAPQQGSGTDEPDRVVPAFAFTYWNININETSCLPHPSHPLFSPLRRFEHEKLKKRKIPGVAYHSLTRSHTADTSRDRLAVQSKRELLSSRSPGLLFFLLLFLPFFFFFNSATPPAHAICLFLKSDLPRCVSCPCVAF